MLHSRFGPSCLNRRYLCPGSAWIDIGEDEGGDDAKRGTALHGEMAQLLTGKNAKIWSDEVTNCYNYLFGGVLKERFKRMEVEMQINLGFIHEHLNKEIGNIDLAVWNVFSDGHIFDWKFGFGDLDPAWQNFQCSGYALALARKYELCEVTAHLVNGNTGYASVARFTEEDFDGIEKTIKGIIERCIHGEGEYHPCKTACQYCKGILICPAIKEIECKDLPGIPGLSMTDLGEYLNDIEIINAKFKAAKQEAWRVLSAGGHVPGWNLAPGRQSRVWDQSLNYIANQLNVPASELQTEPEMVSVAVAEKKLKDRKKELAQFWKKKEGKLSLKKIGDAEEDEE